MKISVVGLDLAKSVFQLNGVDDKGEVVLRRRLRRSEVLTFFSRLPSLPDRYGGLRHLAFLGARACFAGTLGSAYPSVLREALREAK